jgi:predicted permease
VIAGRLAQQFPETNEGWRIALRPLYEELVGNTRATLAILLGAVFFVLLIGCVNVANLLLARATAREREIAVRVSLGAGRGRIIRQLLTESLFLASLGGGAGILLAQGTIQALRMLGPEQLPRLQSVSLDGRILLFNLGVTLLAGLMFGLAPAWRGGQVNLNESLKEAGRSATGVRQRRVRDALVMAEVALALSLLIGAGLLLRSFWKIQQTDSGFKPERVLTASLSLPAARYGDDAKVTAFYQQLLNRIAALGGVQSAGLTSDLPWTGYDENAGGFSVEGKTFPPDQGTEARYHYVSDEYFRTIDVPLIAGRFFNAADRIDTPKVVLINQSMASRYWPGENAVGKRFTWADRPQEKDWYNVVGVVGDIKDFPHSAAASPAFFWPISQQPPVGARNCILAVRTKSDPLQLVEALRKEVRALDKDLPLAEVKTLEAVTSAAVAGRRFALWLVGLLALIAMSLAAVGTYSVLSYLVAQRTREIGIRMALGAQTRDVQRLVIGHGMKPALGGVSLGLLASLALTRLMQNLLYGVSASDPITFGVIALLSLAVALVACWLPARRATRVDPLTSLRHE